MHPSVQPTESNHSYSIPVSMAPSSSGIHNREHVKRIVLFDEKNLQSSLISTEYSFDNNLLMLKDSNVKNKCFNSCKTLSKKFERQISSLRNAGESDLEADGSRKNETKHASFTNLYLNGLEGPEIDKLKSPEVLVLPTEQKWPFLLRFPISSFGMCLGVSSQAILWKTMSDHVPFLALHVCLAINLILWCFSLALVVTMSIIYSLKLIFYFEAVRREYYHPIRVNFFFAPWIACLFLALGLPPVVGEKLSPTLWYVLMAPIFCLELKIYGQWMSGGKRSLSKVANPSNHLSIVGNFVGTLLGAHVGLKEGPVFFFAIGLAHYIVLFVTLYQRLPTNETLPKDLHPVFFLFVAAPSVACIAWEEISGDFGYGSRIAYFVALFLYASLAVRVNFFTGFRFSLSWWAYTFPMTGASIATFRYSTKVTNVFTKSLSFGLCAISALTVMALLTATIIDAFVLRNLFPNDIAIAITEKRPKSSEKHKFLKTAISLVKEKKFLSKDMLPIIDLLNSAY